MDTELSVLADSGLDSNSACPQATSVFYVHQERSAAQSSVIILNSATKLSAEKWMKISHLHFSVNIVKVEDKC